MRRLAPLAALLIFVLVPAGASSAAKPPATTADLKVAKSDSPDPVTAGSQLTYTITAENLGPSPATGVSVTDNLPSGTELVSATGPTGPCATSRTKATCTIGSLAPVGITYNGTPATVTVVIVPRKPGHIRNVATIKGAQKDPVGSNNRAVATTTVLAPPTCGGLTATVVGTPGSDTLEGTPGPDVIVALGGNDRIVSGTGRDVICAGAGGDRVLSGTAADRVYAGPGPDRVHGGGGPDSIGGSRGNDLLKGGPGSDQIRGGRGRDRCRGGGGRDTIRSCER
jgi:uncharacterized repeat protein (TIGR01451 family)